MVGLDTNVAGDEAADFEQRLRQALPAVAAGVEHADQVTVAKQCTTVFIPTPR